MTSWPGTPDLPARDRVQAHLAQYGRGRENAVTQDALAHELGLPKREIQGAIEELRRDGVAVVTGSVGCYLTADPEELRASYRALRRRAIHQLANLRRMLRTAEAMERPMVMPWAHEEEAA